MTTTSHLRTLLVGVVAAALMTGGVAFAYFTASGSGSGAATATTMQTVTVTTLVGGDTPNSTLIPGGPAADVILRASNPNSFSVTIYSVAGSGAIAPDPSHAACTTTGVTFTPPATPNITLPPGSSLVHLAGAATMSTASVSGCQNATFTIPITLTVHR